jgi:hypothetical protein
MAPFDGRLLNIFSSRKGYSEESSSNPPTRLATPMKAMIRKINKPG